MTIKERPRIRREILSQAGPYAIIKRYAEVARPLLIASFGVKSCIQSTRVTIECLRRFGVRAEACPVSLVAQSARTGDGWACGPEEELRRRAGGATLVDLSPPGQVWRAHHVAIAEGGNSNRYLVDASFDQINLSDIEIPPMVHFMEFDGCGARLGSFDDYLYASLPPEGPELFSVTYKEIEDRTYITRAPGEPDVQPVVDAIFDRIITMGRNQ
jgi:hypothetical protein